MRNRFQTERNVSESNTEQNEQTGELKKYFSRFLMVNYELQGNYF